MSPYFYLPQKGCKITLFLLITKNFNDFFFPTKKTTHTKVKKQTIVTLYKLFRPKAQTTVGNPMQIKKNNILSYLWKSREAFIWIAALILLGTMTVDNTCEHHSLCVFKLMGLPYCPGCGLGRSIALLFHGQFTAAWEMNPMGFAAIPILSYRVISILRKEWKQCQFINSLNYK